MTHRPHVRFGLGDPSHGMQVSRVAPDGPAPNLMHSRRVPSDLKHTFPAHKNVSGD